MSIDDQIKEIIQNADGGKIFFVQDFAEIGSRAAIYTTLHRLTKRGSIDRIAQGIYVKPKLNEFLNTEVLATAEEVALAVANRDRARLLPTGSYAMH